MFEMLIKMCFAENKPEWIRILVHVVLLGFFCYFYNHVAVTGSVALKADLRTCWTSAIAEWIVSFVAVILHWYLLTRYKYRNTKKCGGLWKDRHYPCCSASFVDLISSNRSAKRTAVCNALGQNKICYIGIFFLDDLKK